MDVPGVVQSALGDEQVAAEVPLDSEDSLFVTPTRTIIYRGEGLLSDEAVEEYTHDADRVVVSSGRRKARITLHDDLEGERSFTVPPDRLDDALHPVLAGVLNAAGVTEPGETVKRTFRFSELTVIVTSRRLVKHIGEAVWDPDYEEYHFEDATGLDFEEGSVATQVVLEVDGRRERIKAPNEQAPELRAELEEALFDFYDVASIEEFERATSPEVEQEEPETDEVAEDEDAISFESGLSPLSTGSPSDDADREPEEGTTEPDATVPEESAGLDGESAPGGPDSDPTEGSAQSTGEAAGSSPGQTAGESPGQSAGDSPGQSTGGPAGESTDVPAGESADASADGSAGEPTGTTGEATGESAGERAESAIDPSGTTASEATEESGTSPDETGSPEAPAESAAREAAEMARTAAEETAESAETVGETAEQAAAGVESEISNEELAERLDDLTAAVKHQNELLETHAQTIEQLIEELKRMQ